MAREHHRLRLRVEDLEDISILSSMVQDGLIALCDTSYLPGDKSFVLILNRFCWEDVTDENDSGPFSRTHTAIRFDGVKNVQMRDIETSNKDVIHNLLTVAYDAAEQNVVFHFAGGGAIRLEVASLNCAVEDMGDVWPTYNKPGHVVGN